MFSANIKNSRSSHLAVLMIVLGTLIAFASAAAGGYQQSSYQQSSYGGGGGYNYSPVKTLVVPTQYETVDAAIASAQNGDTIKIIGDPSRTFCAFTVTKQLNIIGVNNPIIGAVGCNLQPTEAGIKITAGGSGSVISGLTVNGFNIGVFICGASGSQVAEVTLKDLTIQSCNWVGIKVDCGYKIVITYCKLVTPTGIKIINSKEVTITYCTFSCGKKAITICGCTVVTITYNTITVCRIGIIILGDSNVLIKQNTITASILAIGIACVDTVEISYNKLSAGIITIINLLGTSCNITYNQVYCTSNFNLFFFDIGVGIVTYGVDNLSITYNNVLVLDNAVGILVLGDLSWCGKEAAVVVISYNNIVIRGEIKIVAFGIIAAKVKDFEISYNKVNIVNTSTDNKWPVVTIAILVVFVSGQRNKMIYNDGRYADYGIVIIFCLGQIILSGNLGRNFANGIEWYGQPNDYLRVSSDWFLGTLVSGTAATAAQNPLGSEMGIALTSGVTSRFSPVMGIMTDQALGDSDINSTVKTRFTTFASTAPRVATIQQDS